MSAIGAVSGTRAVSQAVLGLFKLRIGVVIAYTALAGLAVTPGRAATAGEIVLLALAVLVSSASAGAFNQYVERDLDARMGRTRGRAFVTGALAAGPGWLWLIAALLAASVAVSWTAFNAQCALFVFLGAFFYGVVYTLWLKRRTWLNIVIGGLAGSFAVLAGAAAVDPGLPPVAWLLALVLFLWTPPHFWSLAIACQDDYRAARVPMLPVVVGEARCARVILAHTVALVLASLLPLGFGLGGVYLAGAALGGGWFLRTSWRLARTPTRRNAMLNFHASLGQLTLLLTAAIVEGALGG